MQFFSPLSRVKEEEDGVLELEPIHNNERSKELAVQGKYYLRIQLVGEGSKWRRSYGREIYYPLLLAFTEQQARKYSGDMKGRNNVGNPKEVEFRD
ncbi:galactose mutarotase-like domain-containing protein [Artemisia annua]|uniref:Galactose mutarotase-like domain-containing protein n=1 Tax=Artemisia annua TaxID=35608 RepID=A0A2U1KB75_ARTAN|nr:galactose mutarotase-like domain-containing protein [Artemisia annua]